jgi:hypothetical protein
LMWVLMSMPAQARDEEDKWLGRKDKTMEVATAKVSYGVKMSVYSISSMASSMIEMIDGRNYMLDAQGNKVRRWFGEGGGFGAGGTPMGGEARVTSLPKTVHLAYYDHAERMAYEGEFELPMQRMYELFQLKTLGDWGDAANPEKVRPFYKFIKFGIAPNGYVVVWLSGDEEQMELGQYWIKPLPNFSPKEYNKGYGSTGANRISIEMEENSEKWWPSVDTSPEVVQKLKKGWKPSYTTWEERRVQYPWRVKLKAPFKLTDYQVVYEFNQAEMIYPWRMKSQEAPRLRPVPRSFNLGFNDSKGQRYIINVSLYDSFYGVYQADITEVREAFKKIYPERTVKDHDKPVSEGEMATVEVEVDETMDNVSAYVVKGQARYEIPVNKAKLIKVAPYTYSRTLPPSTPEEISAFELGPEWVLKNGQKNTLSRYTHAVKAGDLCPKAGEWVANHLDNKQVYVKAGEVMPGPMYAPNGSTVLWYRLRPDGEK